MIWPEIKNHLLPSMSVFAPANMKAIVMDIIQAAMYQSDPVASPNPVAISVPTAAMTGTGYMRLVLDGRFDECY